MYLLAICHPHRWLQTYRSAMTTVWWTLWAKSMRFSYFQWCQQSVKLLHYIEDLYAYCTITFETSTTLTCSYVKLIYTLIINSITNTQRNIRLDNIHKTCTKFILTLFTNTVKCSHSLDTVTKERCSLNFHLVPIKSRHGVFPCKLLHSLP